MFLFKMSDILGVNTGLMLVMIILVILSALKNLFIR